MNKNQFSELKGLLKDFSENAMPLTKEKKSFIKKAWPFQEIDLRLDEGKYQTLLKLLRRSRSISVLWGLQDKKTRRCEVLCPIISVDSESFNIDISVKTYCGELHFYTTDESTLLAPWFDCFVPFSPYNLDYDFDSILNLNILFARDKVENKKGTEDLKQIYCVIDGVPELEEQDLFNLFRRLSFSLQSIAPSGVHLAIEQPHLAEVKAKWNRPGKRKGLHQIKSVLVDKYRIELVNHFLASRKSPSRMRYLYFYNVIEYLLDIHEDRDIARRIRDSLAKPDAPNILEEVAWDVISKARQANSQNSVNRLSDFLKSLYNDPGELSILIRATGLDDKVTKFDGGLVLDKLGSSNYKDRKIFNQVANAIVEIRNALVHYGMTYRQTILPTLKNDVEMWPWVTMLDEIAGKAIISYRQ